MGFLKKREQRRNEKILKEGFKVINGYSPVFTTYSGGIYEMELTRAAIDTISSNVSKLNPVINSKSVKFKKLNNMLRNKPNHIMTTQQFLYRISTILLCENNAFIVPIYEDNTAQTVVGIYPVRGAGARIVTQDGIDYLIYKIDNKEYAEEYSRVGHLRRHYYKNEYSGDSNLALKDTLDLLYTQHQGIKEGIKSSANIRFSAKLAQVIMPDKLKEEKKRLVEDNLSIENNSGVLLFDGKYSDIKQIDSKPFIVDSSQTELINKNVYNYFHVSEEIMQNKATEEQWNAFYEGNIEVIALQLGQVLSNMLLDEKEKSKGIEVILESNRLQFSSNATKLNIAQILFDRGILTQNQVNDIFNLPRVEDGDKRYIRKEYAEINQLGAEEVEEEKTKILDEIKLKELEKEKPKDEEDNLKEGEEDEQDREEE